MNSPPSLTVRLESIMPCFEGIVPSSICSCSRDGTPNLTFLSIVHRIDQDHVALSHQFFNKTRKNMMENPAVQVVVVSPETWNQYRLDLHYERTETQGPIFDRMRTRLEAVASQTGMSHVFKLRGVDVYRVLDCRGLDSEVRTEGSVSPDHLFGLEGFTGQLADCSTLESLINTTLDALSSIFGYDHSFLMVPDEDDKRLYTLASRGYESSGVGSEVWVGEGILGVAAEQRILLRTTNFTRDILYARAVRSNVERRGEGSNLEREIALPGLPEVQSQLVAPLVAHGQLLGLLCLQSSDAGRFLSGDEGVMHVAARHLAASMAMLRRTDTLPPHASSERSVTIHPAMVSTVKHYCEDDSVFIDDAYLIKGVAGRIFWKLLQDHARFRRVDFTNRELRLDSGLQLPDFKDNLEARLILLRRRLQERCESIRLTQIGRGRFHLEVHCQLTLDEHA